MDASTLLALVLVRDGLLAWVLVHYLLNRGSTPPPSPAIITSTSVSPGPVPSPVLPPVAKTPRFTDITATSFGGPGDANSSAYGGMVDPNVPGVALPYHFTKPTPNVRVFLGDKHVDCAVVDVGPWNINDPYWQTGSRPQAESGTDVSGRHTNLAGIDLTPAAWVSLGYPLPNSAKTKVSWDFIDYLDGKTQTPSVAGIPPWLATMRGLIGIKAGGDNPVIMDMPAFIGATFPDMKDYSSGYKHDSTAWCGLSAAFCMAKAGIRPPFGATDTDKFLWAYAWSSWGTLVASDDDIRPGDVIVWTWADGSHHVTFYDHRVETDDNFWCCGGNQQGHTVSVEPIAMSNRHVIRRPPQ